MNQYTKLKVISALRPELCGDNLLTAKRHPQRSLSRQSHGHYWQLKTRSTKRQNTYKCKL